jgi:hypothetical protein
VPPLDTLTGRLDSVAGKRFALAVASQRQGVVVAAIALGALALGTLVYVVDRVPGHALLIPHVGAFTGATLFGTVGAWLPSLVHPFSFALLTAAALPAGSPWRYGGCVGWGLANVAFELGQHPALKGWWRDSFEGRVASPLGRYFIHGSFDVRDLVAAVAGALAAAVVLRLLDLATEHRHAC